MSTHFYGSDFFSGDFFGSAPTPVVVYDTHDGERKRRRDEEQRKAVLRRRQQITDAFDPPGTADARAAIPGESDPARSGIAFDFDADDEEIIILL